MISATKIAHHIKSPRFANNFITNTKVFNRGKQSVRVEYNGVRVESFDKHAMDARPMKLLHGADLIGLRNEFINGDNTEKSRLWSMFVYGDLLNRKLDPALSDNEVFGQVVDSMSDIYKRFTPPMQGKTQEIIMAPTSELVEETLTTIANMANDAKDTGISVPQKIGDKVHQRATSLVTKIKNAGQTIKDKVEAVDEKLEQARPVLKAVNRPEILSDSGMNFVSAVLDAIDAKRKVASSIKEPIKTAEIVVADSALPGIGEPLTEAKYIKDIIDGIEEDTKDAAAELIVDAVLRMDNLDDDGPGLQP